MSDLNKRLRKIFYKIPVTSRIIFLHDRNRLSGIKALKRLDKALAKHSFRLRLKIYWQGIEDKFYDLRFIITGKQKQSTLVGTPEESLQKLSDALSKLVE